MAAAQCSRLIICVNHKFCILMKEQTFLKSNQQLHLNGSSERQQLFLRFLQLWNAIFKPKHFQYFSERNLIEMHAFKKREIHKFNASLSSVIFKCPVFAAINGHYCCKVYRHKEQPEPFIKRCWRMNWKK